MSEGGGPSHRFAVGDILLVGCPFVRTRVVEATPFEVSVEWPWGEIDPESAVRWNGRRSIPVTGGAGPWGGLFRTDPDPRFLKAGDSCRVGVPDVLVRVVDIGRFDPPADVGWLPRPHTMLVVLPLGHPCPAGAEEEGDTIDLDSAAPFTLRRVARG
ncbi:hypothetical protein ACIF8T_16730 [Streptomyces sp. NPDC085946]|uniref:hypothetical protein n=1 Tax=Streptomyces sp. NPDC085946 TaxID=3365744 RepID=UPI0037D6D98C